VLWPAAAGEVGAVGVPGATSILEGEEIPVEKAEEDVSELGAPGCDCVAAI
jgi:hypothetical protein